MSSTPTQPAQRTRPRVCLALLAACTLALGVAGCNRTSAPPADATANSNTPRGPLQPRTNPPMPPIATAHGGPANGAPPRATAPAANAQSSWTLLDGRRARTTDFKGQVLVLDFWATYCPPCREEVPHLMALQQRYGAQGLHVVGLNVGGAEDRPKVADFVREFRIQYPLGYPSDELAQAVFADNDAIPQTYVFDRNGRLVKRFVGFDAAVATGIETAVQTALNN